MNAEFPDWGADLLARACAQLGDCLHSALPAHHDRARLLLRLLACLAATHVTHPSAAVGLLAGMVDAAADLARSGGRTGRRGGRWAGVGGRRLEGDGVGSSWVCDPVNRRAGLLCREG